MGHKVDYERWKKAQEWEKTFWDASCKNLYSITNLKFLKTLINKVLGREKDLNKNYWWSKQFDDYRFIPNKLKNVIEFGCGHTTNLRVALEGREAEHVFASDPLVKHYIKYRGHPLSKKWRAGEYMIDSHPMEEAPFCDDYFDLAICINVMDHVMDVPLCMENLTRVVKPNGILIFAQNLTSEEDIQAPEELVKSSKAEVGHPHVFPNEDFFLPYFKDFEPLVKKVLKREEGYAPLWNKATLVYAGKKLGNDINNT